MVEGEALSHSDSVYTLRGNGSPANVLLRTPSQKNDPERVYGFGYAGLEVRFRVSGDRLEVVEIEET